MFRVLFIVVMTLMSSSVFSAVIDTLNVYSSKMNRNVEVVIVSPEKEKQSSCPVLYLLHGYSGNAKTWISINENIPKMSDRDGVIVVCPNCENSWYWDSPINSGSQFETFITKELLPYVDTHYNTIKSRNYRAITGLSMGGHGALWLSFRHKTLFGAAGSTSGGVDIRPFPNNWRMKNQIGPKDENLKRWDEYTVINQVDSIKDGDLSLIIDCGADDFFYEVNNEFHKKLLDRGINHDYIIRPGKHNAVYWKNSIEYQWLFFTKFFNGYRYSDK